MNIAILLTGQIRKFHDVKENLNFLFSNCKEVNIDYFCTTDYDPDVNLNEIKNEFDFKILDVESYNEHTIQFIKNAHDFKKFCTDYKNDDPDYLRFSEYDRQTRLWYNFPIIVYRLNKGIKLIESYQLTNNKSYDLILRIRWDIYFLSPFKKEHILEASKTNALYVYKHCYKTYLNSNEYKNEKNINNIDYTRYADGWVDETFFYGNCNVFNRFVNIYDNYYNIALRHNTWITHQIFKKYIEENNIETLMPLTKVALVRKDFHIKIFTYL